MTPGKVYGWLKVKNDPRKVYGWLKVKNDPRKGLWMVESKKMTPGKVYGHG